ncbi:Grx4 family monothiol glutaredoxin [Cognatiluteimonas profundi]|uniref:Grx4 family monothiol glutaredoxin n=1 Tax=Cognatiluteimonas profundi TaxID=2594501 RepID=UPI00131AFE23|nr:Grx4 family monothiol glutaredoxin [Lysobacter profundi]
MSLDPAMRQRISNLLDSQRIVLFMKGEPRAPQCGFSAKAVAALAELGVDYAHVDVLADPGIRDGIKAYGDWPTIPQLYIDAQLVGGSDIIEQMAGSGELHAMLGLPPPDRTPPDIRITDAAMDMLRGALGNAGEGHALRIEVDARFNTRLQLAPLDAGAIAAVVDGIRVQFDAASARRADGLSIDWVDDARGRGLVIDNPNAPPAVRALSPMEAAGKLAAGAITLVDVRPAEERAFAVIKAPFSTLDQGTAALEQLPKDTPLAFLCHHGNRSGQAAEHFRQLGFTEVYNVDGGIDAWARMDPAIPAY